MGIPERQQQQEIDGVMYIVNPLPFGIGNKALLRFTKLVGSALASIPADGKGVAAIGAILGHLEDSDVEYFRDVFGNACWYMAGDKQVPLVKQNQDAHFDGRYSAFYEWLALNVGVNFGSFLSEQLKRVGLDVSQLKAQISSALPAKSGSPGA